MPKDRKPLELKAGEGVSGEVNSLLLSGVEWPGGVNRSVMFKIAVGERVVTTAFHYSSDIHDQMRADALAEVKK